MSGTSSNFGTGLWFSFPPPGSHARSGDPGCAARWKVRFSLGLATQLFKGTLAYYYVAFYLSTSGYRREVRSCYFVCII